MMLRVLKPSQIEQFIECGYTPLEEAFPRRNALAVQGFLWERLAERGILRDDRSTWTAPVCHIRESYSTADFQACATERLKDAVEDLLGIGRWRERDHTGHWGWWPVNFSKEAGQPWTVPTGGWHWDGQHFRHYVDAPVQGLLLLCMFSEIGPRGGGTLVAEGSHRIVARFLSLHPEGLELHEAIPLCHRSHPWLRELTGITELDRGSSAMMPATLEPSIPASAVSQPSAPPATPGPAASSDIYAAQDGPTGDEAAALSRVARFMDSVTRDADGGALKVTEITAAPGDVFLCHPFLYHAASANPSGIPRFMCNRTTPLRERMCFHRPDGDYSPLEASIRRALHLE